MSSSSELFTSKDGNTAKGRAAKRLVGGDEDEATIWSGLVERREKEGGGEEEGRRRGTLVLGGQELLQRRRGRRREKNDSAII